MRRLVIMTVLLTAACVGLAAEDRYLLTLRFTPGQVVSYDGSYMLQVPAGNGGKGLTLAAVNYGLVLRVEAVDGQGATIDAEYDRFDSYLRFSLREQSPGSSFAGRRFRFKIAPEGKMQPLAGAPWSPDWGGLPQPWTGWPSGPLLPGEGWREDDALEMPGGGRTRLSREYRLCQIDARAAQPLALLDYTEEGEIAAVPVRLANGRAFLDGRILGVGQVKFDLDAGLIVGAASVSTLTGLLHEEEAAGTSLGSIRLEIETRVTLRANTAP
ncbi:MAG: hypothetical protein ACM3ZC_14435 [Bacteroidota bacterium]